MDKDKIKNYPNTQKEFLEKHNLSIEPLDSMCYVVRCTFPNRLQLISRKDSYTHLYMFKFIDLTFAELIQLMSEIYLSFESKKLIWINVEREGQYTYIRLRKQFLKGET